MAWEKLCSNVRLYEYKTVVKRADFSKMLFFLTARDDELESHYIERKSAWIRYIHVKTLKMRKELSNLSQAHHEIIHIQGALLVED